MSDQPNQLIVSPAMGKLEAIQTQAKAMIASGLMPKGITTVSQVITIALMGEALGIPPIVAVNMINIIQGKPTISPQLMLGIVNRSGLLTDMKLVVTDTEATMTVQRKGHSNPHTEVFSMEDARKLVLTGKDNWNKQPRTMMKWRVVAACLRVVFPDILLGFYTPEEMGANVVIGDDDSMVIDATLVSTEGTRLANEAEAIRQPEPPVDGNAKVNSDAMRKKFFGACRARGLESVVVGKLIMAAQKNLSDLSWDQAMAIAFPEPASDQSLTPAQKADIPF